jgi:hypothetical protein
MEDDRSYFERRAAQERSAADEASDESARDAHLRLAERYGELARAQHKPSADTPTPA